MPNVNCWAKESPASVWKLILFSWLPHLQLYYLLLIHFRSRVSTLSAVRFPISVSLVSVNGLGICLRPFSSLSLVYSNYKSWLLKTNTKNHFPAPAHMRAKKKKKGCMNNNQHMSKQPLNYALTKSDICKCCTWFSFSELLCQMRWCIWEFICENVSRDCDISHVTC